VSTWGAKTSWGEVCCRAGGRRRYNAKRRAQKQYRRTQIFFRLAMAGLPKGAWGVQTVLAEQLGVSRATICRDMKAIRDAGSGKDPAALLR
jgi:hypothetical protein